MRIAMVGNFHRHSERQPAITPRKLMKGFIRNGHDVLPFCYQSHLLHYSPIRKTRWARRLGRARTDKLCSRLLTNYRPDLVVLVTYWLAGADSIRKLRDALPEARFLGWYHDALDGMDDDHIRINRLMDCFLATGGGEHLRQAARRSGIPGGYMPFPCDPDLERPYPRSADLASKLLFTGRLRHTVCPCDPFREEVISELHARYGMTVHGDLGNPRILGVECCRRVSNTQIAVSINAANHIRMYHSDRLVAYLACGAFVLARSVPDTHLLFEDGKHLRYFSTRQECLDLVEYYLEHPEERERIARRGMLHAHERFNCQRIAKDVIDFVETGTYDEPWQDVVVPGD